MVACYGRYRTSALVGPLCEASADLRAAEATRIMLDRKCSSAIRFAGLVHLLQATEPCLCR
jgi:hypothetical protein